MRLAVHEVGGSGPTFALVHGFTGSSRDFADVAPQLTDLRTVVLIDQLGHGASPHSDVYSYDRLTDALVATLEALPGPVDILGHSLGGRTVLPIAYRRPELVRSLIVMDGWADQPDRGEPGRELAAALAAGVDVEDALAAFEESRGNGETDLLIAGRGLVWHNGRIAANAAGFDKRAYAQLAPLVFVAGENVLARCSAIDCQTTIIVGEHDAPFLGPCRRLAERIPRAQLVTIPGAYHSPQLTHPAEWLSAVRAHLVHADSAA